MVLFLLFWWAILSFRGVLLLATIVCCWGSSNLWSSVQYSAYNAWNLNNNGNTNNNNKYNDLTVVPLAEQNTKEVYG